MGAAPAARRSVDVVELNPHAPRPYTFTEAALCLRASIEAAGYRCQLYVNQADTLQPCLVLGALPPRLGALGQLDPSRAVIVNLEQLGSGSTVIGQEYEPWLRGWLVADYHSANLEHLRRASGGLQRACELPLVPGRCLSFRPDLPADKTVDVLFFGTPNARRRAIVQALEAAGLRVETVAGAFAHELTPAIRRARLVLHVHFYDTGLFPISRVLQPVADGVPIVCEASVFSAQSDWSRSGIVFAPYEELVDACRRLLAAPAEQAERARRSREFAARLDFATPFARLLEMLDAMAPQAPDEIEALAAREAEQLPPEAHLEVPPLKLAERQPGRGGRGLWLAGLLFAFSLLTLWQALRALTR